MTACGYCGAGSPGGELRVRSGMPAPGFIVEVADPVAPATGLLLRALHYRADDWPGTRVRCAGLDGCPAGDVLVIEAINRKVVYQVTRRMCETCDVFELRFPD